MKIVDSLSNPSGIADKLGKDEIKLKTDRGEDFKNQLIRAEDSNYEQHIKSLLDRIDEQGETLAKRVDVRELRKYRKLISEFLDVALSNSKKFSRQSLLDRRGRHKVYTVIKNVNDELDKLTQDVMSSEKDNISLLKRLDDIRGLILDLFL